MNSVRSSGDRANRDELVDIMRRYRYRIFWVCDLGHEAAIGPDCVGYPLAKARRTLLQIATKQFLVGGDEFGLALIAIHPPLPPPAIAGLLLDRRHGSRRNREIAYPRPQQMDDHRRIGRHVAADADLEAPLCGEPPPHVRSGRERPDCHLGRSRFNRYSSRAAASVYWMRSLVPME